MGWTLYTSGAFPCVFVWVPKKMQAHNCLRALGLIHRCVISSPYCTPPSHMWSDGEVPCLLFLADPFGKTDEREPLTNAVRSDSAVIGGKPFLVAESRGDINDSVLGRNVFDSFLNYSYLAPRTPRDLQGREPAHE